jgi:hypothetical protein
MVEILAEIKGVDFDAAWERRAETVGDPESGLTALLISLGDLIRQGRRRRNRNALLPLH